jgi:hypothetical protein
MMIERPRRQGYQLHAPECPAAVALLSEGGISRPDLDRAIVKLERIEGIAIRTIVGINDDGVFGSRQNGWQPVLPDAYAQPFIPLLWLEVLELLGRVPRGSTARFLENGSLPEDLEACRAVVNQMQLGRGHVHRTRPCESGGFGSSRAACPRRSAAEGQR